MIIKILEVVSFRRINRRACKILDGQKIYTKHTLKYN